MEIFETIVEVGNSYVWGFPKALPWLVVILLGTGLFITLRLGFLQLRELRHSVRVVTGKYDDPNDPGDVSHFQALSTALSATVGIGNIAGVAIAIHFGGPGALFWMWVTAFFGMALKYAECTLAVHYRSFDDKGEVAGGPMYYIEKGLGKSWKPLAMAFAFFAIISSFGGGNMNQANTVAASAHAEFGFDVMIVGIVIAVLVAVVILGGIRSIARVASTLAPTMAILYVGTALVILIMHAGDVPGAFGTIFSEAFNPTASVSGSVAGGLMVTLLWGVKRGLFSNEAGQGSAPIAHAAARTDEPVREGAVAMLEPLIDTLVICTMTGLVIVITGVWDKKQLNVIDLAPANVLVVGSDGSREALDAPAEFTITNGVVDRLVFTSNDGVVDEATLTAGGQPITGIARWHGKVGARPDTLEVLGADGTPISEVKISGLMLQTGSALTAWAFSEGLSPIAGFGSLIVTICVFLFALSTMISWSYYGDRCVTYLFGTRYVIVYRAVYVGFVYIGATTALQVVWDYGDLALGLMTLPNLIAVLLLSPRVVTMTREYYARMRSEQEGSRG
ncbi:MAG TPA: sodium:alanine symporter family protein [Kofleriaceae bacterium]|nr:sodium:alanine symporter family protein [Kofleriaceae bacterium]